LALGPLGTSVIHGDLHSGNVILRRRGGRPEPVLLDWGRARIGSPLEDVSTWLQSLGDWEPETRRRHDTLFTRYLVARGIEGRLGGELRAGYWLAGASNALAGALSHHLSLLDDERIPRVRTTRAAHSAHQWMRVLRRADAFWS
jgi:aminoglycoside phosphotransferase (APT) family kinase protein